LLPEHQAPIGCSEGSNSAIALRLRCPLTSSTT
jgi:hypothetical protein